MNDLIVHPHPLTTQDRVVMRAAVVYPRESLAEFLERNGVAVGGGRWLVTIGGAVVPAQMWAFTRPKPGQLILCRAVPGKQAILIVAMIALTVFTFGAGALTLAGLTGLSGAALFAAQVGVYMIGSMVINKVLGPSSARHSTYSQQTGSTYSLQGGRNRARPYEPLGLLLGVTKVVPDFNAQPFTWFASDEQYQAVRLHAGINCGSVADIKIGTTPIASFTDVVESRVGFASGNSTLPFWSDVDTLAGATLNAPTSPGAYVTRTSSTGAVMLAVDVVAQLYAMNSSGKMESASLTIELQRRLLPSGSWVPLLDAGVSVTLTSKSTKVLRRTFTSARLTAGQYEVRLRKVTANQSSTTKSNVIDWASLKTFQEDPSGGYQNQNPQVALSIKASGQLSGVLDEVNWVATQASVPRWTGSAWLNEATRNPGAQILLLARGIYGVDGRLLAGLGLPDSQIDIDGLKAFMVHCQTNGYVFDHWFDSQLSCIEMLEVIAAAGMGSISFHPGKLSVVWLASGQAIEAVVTMGNIKQGTFRVDHTTTTTADELEVTWFDRDNGWVNRSLRIKAPGVTTPRDTARLAPLGVTTEAAAVRTARLAMGQNIYQRKSVSWEMDLEHMAFQRYSLIALSHDLTQWGYSGRVQSATMGAGSIVTLTLDDTVPWNAGAAARKIGLRIPGESGYRIFSVATFAGTTNTITLGEAWPAGVALPGNSSSNPAFDTLWIYDFAAQPGKRLRVTEIEPSPDLSGAKITAVPEPDEFWTYMASGAYTAPAAPAAGPALGVSNIKVSQRRLGVNVGEGTELSIAFDVTGPFNTAQVWGAPDGEALQLLGSTLVPRFGPWTVTREDGSNGYAIEVRPFDALGRLGTKATASHAVTLEDESVSWTSIDDGGNLLRNSSFEADSDADGLADNWTAYSAGTTGTVTYSRQTNGPIHGTYKQRFGASGLGTGTDHRVGIYQQVSVIAGQPYVLSVWYGNPSGTPKCRLYVDWYDASMTIVGASNSAQFAPVGTLGRASLKGAAPATAAYARAYIWMEANSSGPGLATLDIDAAQLQMGTVLTGYAPSVLWGDLSDKPADSALLNAYAGSNFYWPTGPVSSPHGEYGRTPRLFVAGGADQGGYGLKPGEVLTISADLWCDASTLSAGQYATLFLYCAQAGGTWIATAQINGATTTPTRYSASVTLPALADMSTVAVGLYHQGTNAAASPTGAIYADRIQVERGAVATQYQPSTPLGSVDTPQIKANAATAVFEATATSANNSSAIAGVTITLTETSSVVVRFSGNVACFNGSGSAKFVKCAVSAYYGGTAYGQRTTSWPSPAGDERSQAFSCEATLTLAAGTHTIYGRHADDGAATIASGVTFVVNHVEVVKR